MCAVTWGKFKGGNPWLRQRALGRGRGARGLADLLQTRSDSVKKAIGIGYSFSRQSTLIVVLIPGFSSLFKFKFAESPTDDFCAPSSRGHTVKEVAVGGSVAAHD